jgi:hypothetical protein
VKEVDWLPQCRLAHMCYFEFLFALCSSGDGRWLRDVQRRRRSGAVVDRREHHNAAAVARRGIGMAWIVEGGEPGLDSR